MKCDVVPDFTTKTGRVVKFCSLCRVDKHKNQELEKRKRVEYNAVSNAKTSAKLAAKKLAALVKKVNLTKEQILALIEERTSDAIMFLERIIDDHPEDLFYVYGAAGYRFRIERAMFLSGRGLSSASGKSSGPPLRMADGGLVHPGLFSQELEICNPMFDPYICDEVEKIVHLHFNNNNNKLWKVPGAGSVAGKKRNRPKKGMTYTYKISITTCSAKKLRGCTLNNKTDRKVV
jgi:hypothetical protein